MTALKGVDQRFASLPRNKSKINNCASAKEKKSSLAIDDDNLLPLPGQLRRNHVLPCESNSAVTKWDGLVKSTDNLVFNEAKA